MRLSGKNAIVTGSNRGIGLAVVEKLALEGANVYACARTRSDKFEEKMQEIASSKSVSIEIVYFDMSDSNALKKEIKNILSKEKHIDILVNNAGISDTHLFFMMPVEKIRSLFEVNYFAQLEILQLVAKLMKKNKTGSIINICSASGMYSEKGGLAYGSSKSALIFATKALALELGEYGIRVNAVSPGFIDTDMWDNRNENLKEKILSETPLGRQGKAEDVADVVAYLASEEASFITGQNIVTDGGRFGRREIIRL